MEPLEVSAAFVAERFPRAEVAVMAGSSASGRRTATSDIDLLLIGPEEMFGSGRSSLATNVAYDGESMELFSYTEQAFEEWVGRDLATFRPVLLNMLAEGLEVRGGARLEELRKRWCPVLEVGPRAHEQELAARRYEVTDLLDDLRDAADPLEQRVTAGLLFEKTAELLLLTNGHWLASSKHLVRALRRWDAKHADDLAAPLLDLDFAAFADRVDAELRRVGGRVQAGFIR
ncbi:nucleotidyltransferase domain-containing protein [Pseudoclavibacter sp. VKM Ac-2867]|uniref:nucleotidyltransferase domain-containing protein n=1 Tax=Pseudoclavibacter sp. VKM Ac-2867 TaxID=2783829 RepID=UPI00188A915A|nr:nucleotidyltransferase domain-containing protein [Pseudoclavibacter sp. VKM Ac-2867]MBF4459575.1 hypothetical protein [Pseudoclavibacter sp. VKM Ac-2867]